eukprot:m.127422 g.127422  ORF g.127422 m.127422 type:complete len:50 (+) comp37922_c0_seq65:566-715(+)
MQHNYVRGVGPVLQPFPHLKLNFDVTSYPPRQEGVASIDESTCSWTTSA